ncbi:MAG: DUF1934 domain-containing protein [Christensenellales bacterium]|jgi:uncharacterized beta-barrel protein YwiB (DUF1934 family)
MQKVLLTIKGMQIDGGKDNYVEFVTEGRLYKKESGYLIEYDESELTGIDGVTTTLVLEQGSVTLLRNGPIDTHMVFSKNSIYESNVSTPYGKLHLSIFAHHVESTFCDQGGSISLEYELNMGNLNTINRLSLSFKSMKDCIN